jgi:two-component system LytT family response regulator
VIKAIVVDDEAPARREMRRLLAAHEDAISVVGDARDLATARGLLLRTRPDVVFLDIRLGKASGFDLLEDVDEETAVVFVTAYDDFAVRAFEASAVDYLVKPVEPGRLAQSVERLEGLASRAKPGRGAAPFTPHHWVFLDSPEASEFVELASITHVSSDARGSRVHTNEGRSIPAARTLAEWERRLPEDDFLRVHRGAIVNLRHVERVEPWSHYGYRLHLRGWAEPVAMSRRYARDVRRRLE